MPKGIVVRYERNAGFGFIETEEGETAFVHHTGIIDPERSHLVAGQHVEFRVEATERGPRAEDVAVVRDVARKEQRQLDWRHRRGGHPRAGEIPGAPTNDEDPEDGVLRSSAPSNRQDAKRADA